MYINKDIKYKHSVINIGKMKAIFTEIFTNSSSIFITSFYRLHEIDFTDFSNGLNEHTKYCSKHINYFIISNMNLDILKTDNIVMEYLFIFYESGYISYINVPTRDVKDSSTCIDHIFGKFDRSIGVRPFVCDLDLTDHQATVVVVIVDKNHNDNINEHPNISKINFNKLLSILKNTNRNWVFSENNVNKAILKFIQTIQDAYRYF